jgi:hypothetical protein
MFGDIVDKQEDREIGKAEYFFESIQLNEMLP